MPQDHSSHDIRNPISLPEKSALAHLPGVKPPSGFDAQSAIRSIQWTGRDIAGGRFRKQLYRFLADSVPAIGACIWTWVRLVSAPGAWRIDDGSPAVREQAEDLLRRLDERIYADFWGRRSGLTSLLSDSATMLFRDGLFGGFAILAADGSEIDRFIAADPATIAITESDRTRPRLVIETPSGEIDLSRPDFFSLSLDDTLTHPLGRSVLQSIPFVSYIEQQLIDDMRRASHNAGFHRLHVKISPPQRMGGESDTAYTERINQYFDATVDMIGSCDIDQNPVTWDNVDVAYIGPSKSRDVSNSWFMNHRAMIEEICAGTNLAPFLLGYSYGATTSWSDFKFDIVMRQVQSVQRQLSSFLAWLGRIELGLHNLDCAVAYEFDNTLTYQIADRIQTRSVEVDSLLKLYQAGLIDRETAATRACRLI